MYTALVLLLTLAAGSVTASNERCPTSSKSSGYLYQYGDECYQFILQEKTWLDAKSYCYARGASLATAKNSGKHNWLVSILVNNLKNVYDKQGFWLGLHDRNREGHWQWDEGPGKSDSSMSWSKWKPGEPNDITGQDCVYMRRSYGWKWVDVGCGDTWHIGRTYSFACQYKKLPPTTTTTTTVPTTTKSTVRTTPPRPTTTPPTVQPPSVAPNKITSETSTPLLLPINVEGIAGSSTKTSDNFLTGAHVGHSIVDEDDFHGKKTASISAGLISCLLIIIAILIMIILLKRRRDKNNLPLAHSLANPCYVDRVCTNNLNRDDNPYATCEEVGLGSNANVYVEVGDNPKAGFIATNESLAISNRRYMESPLQKPDLDTECVENVANDRKAEEQLTLKSRYLDECGTYTSDGYMQQKHIYADVSDIAANTPTVIPSHYDVPEPARMCPLSVDIDAYLYDTPKGSNSCDNIPRGAHYDIPQGSQAVADEYSDATRATNSQSTMDTVHKNPLYDVPKYKLKDYVDTEVEYSV